MEVMVKKFQSKFNKVREEMNQWDELQSRLISQFRNASHIVDRLQVIWLLPVYNFFFILFDALTLIWTVL